MTTTIKRYPNRKLYNTDTKRYITLDGIATLIKEGQEIIVLDHTNGDDLTSLTLSQIIFEQEKKQTGFLPRSVLTTLIQAGGETIGSIRKSVVAPLQFLSPVEGEIDRRLQELVKTGEIAREESIRIRNQLIGKSWSGISAWLPNTENWEEALEKRNIPATDELKTLFAQLDTLIGRIESLVPEEAADADEVVEEEIPVATEQST